MSSIRASHVVARSSGFDVLGHCSLNSLKYVNVAFEVWRPGLDGVLEVWANGRMCGLLQAACIKSPIVEVYAILLLF